jgi:hypothetical protein
VVFNPIDFAFHARNCAHPNAQSFPASTTPSALQSDAIQQLATTAPISAEPAIAQNPKFNYFSPKPTRKCAMMVTVPNNASIPP